MEKKLNKTRYWKYKMFIYFVHLGIIDVKGKIFSKSYFIQTTAADT